ncbi:putative bifunctional diguanylate cyclase/phosphodiesterase [Thermomonospora catenispora]|uniref:putative bifunctional diguanylate cyclase/phosphodiesterase n=1 Tax=Thermomonospora catenispora TaxID=2493090 RepID=UPI0011233F18|nr:bifunctional diguanylate cyclase/phosphodiesterase [Thermomonospora catenispora]TNY38564.1 bifunctional diguanylate cyclase/phosphodiesterase [Thermomonospora catenispora]
MKDPHTTRNTRPRRGSPLWIYFVAVIGVGAAAFAAAMHGATRADLDALAANPVFWILACFIVFGELRPIVTAGAAEHTGATASTTFSFAALLYAGLPVAVALQTLAVVVCGVFRRHAVHRVAFNVAQCTLSLTAAALVLRAFGISAAAAPDRLWVPDGGDLLPIALAGAAYFICNDLFVCTAVALHERTSLIETLRWDLGYQVLVHVALLALAPLVVVTMDRSAAFVPLIALPFLAVYLNASVSVRREHQARHDGLTGLPNRKLLTLRTEEALAAARADRAGERRVGLFLLDLDRFKEVNDTLGHPTGDRLLQIVAHRLTHSVRPGDLVARLGGDEFAVLLPSVRDEQAAREVAARLRVALGEPVRLEGLSFDLEASVGIALYPDHAPDYGLLVQRADVAMYEAKVNRTGVEVYSPAKDRNSPVRLTMLGELGRAVDRGELELHYQPTMPLAGGPPLGLEALLRWRHPDRGLLGPEAFLPIAEQTYLMCSISQYALDAALTQLAAWWREGLTTRIAVNVAARDLLDVSFAETVAAALTRHGLPPDALQLEITERALARDPAYAAGTLDGLARLGVRLALDDYGTGRSALVSLKRLPVEEIKIDSSFISRLADSADDAVIVRSIVELARTLGLRSVAEGVEDASTAQRLRDLGCDAAQGRLFGRPMDADAATDWLRRAMERAPEPAA